MRSGEATLILSSTSVSLAIPDSVVFFFFVVEANIESACAEVDTRSIRSSRLITIDFSFD